VRNIVSYIEEEQLNIKQEREYHTQIVGHLRFLQRFFSANRSRLDGMFMQYVTADDDSEGSLSTVKLQNLLKLLETQLNPQTLFSKEALRELRKLRTRLTRVAASAEIALPLLGRISAPLDAMLTIQGKRFTIGKASLNGIRQLVKEQNLPLEIVDLFAEAKLDREICLEHFGREIGLVNAAQLLLGDAMYAVDGEEHNALFDSRLLRLVILNCFERIDHLQEYLPS
jgi:hypothetical protein